MAAAYSASDYHMNLYLQQQQQHAAVAGGGDFGRLGGGGSSGLLGFPGVGCSSSSPGCGGLEDGGESSAADEQFYAEAYPGKLCALCNLSERSFLGQGEMVRYTVVASEVNLEEYALKRKAAAMETESSGGAAESGGRKSPTTATTPFKRKVRKFTISGESNPQNGEPPPDELDLIGYQVGVATNLLLFFLAWCDYVRFSLKFR
jgi:hypothetical protein